MYRDPARTTSVAIAAAACLVGVVLLLAFAFVFRSADPPSSARISALDCLVPLAFSGPVASPPDGCGRGR